MNKAVFTALSELFTVPAKKEKVVASRGRKNTALEAIMGCADYSLAIDEICGKLEVIRDTGEDSTGVSEEKVNLLLAEILKGGAQFLIQSKDWVISTIVDELIQDAAADKRPELLKALLLIH